MNKWPLEQIRSQFPGLSRCHHGRPVALFDGPAGSQVPVSVADAVRDYLLRTNCNRGASFATSRESDERLEAAHQAVADFLGTDDPATVVFGANMTTITLQLSRALSATWQPGDEIIVTRLDHDANVTPWVLAAQDRGVTVHYIDLHPEDWTLDQEDFLSKLGPRTRLLAVGLASNATGTVNPVRRMIAAAHGAGALCFVDAVHLAPHDRINCQEMGCDFLVCSAYKFFGPHVGILYGRRPLLEELRPYKLRPAPDSLPGRWMTGTQNHEGIVGTAAAVDYLASLAESGPAAATADRSARLQSAFGRIREYEQLLSAQMLAGLGRLPDVRILGITNSAATAQRVPTVSFLVSGLSPREVARRLAEDGVFVWSGNHYALPFTERAGLEPGGTVRAGALHYTSFDDVERLVDAVGRL